MVDLVERSEQGLVGAGPLFGEVRAQAVHQLQRRCLLRGNLASERLRIATITTFPRSVVVVAMIGAASVSVRTLARTLFGTILILELH